VLKSSEEDGKYRKAMLAMPTSRSYSQFEGPERDGDQTPHEASVLRRTLTGGGSGVALLFSLLYARYRWDPPGYSPSGFCRVMGVMGTRCLWYFCSPVLVYFHPRSLIP
jgi:hypothetical protein